MEPAQGRRLGTFIHRWLVSVVFLVVTALALFSGEVDALSITVAVIALLAAFTASPMLFPRPVSDAFAREQAAAGEIAVIYWRPGCLYCIRLRIALAVVGGKAIWVDVSQDPKASYRVREANAGNETVPTVFVGNTAWTNPPPASVKHYLRQG